MMNERNRYDDLIDEINRRDFGTVITVNRKGVVKDAMWEIEGNEVTIKDGKITHLEGWEMFKSEGYDTTVDGVTLLDTITSGVIEDAFDTMKRVSTFKVYADIALNADGSHAGTIIAYRKKSAK